MIKFFEKIKIFYDFQYEFEEEYSVIDALVDGVSLYYDAKNKMFYDFQYELKEKYSVIHALLNVLSLHYDAI